MLSDVGDLLATRVCVKQGGPEAKKKREKAITFVRRGLSLSDRLSRF